MCCIYPEIVQSVETCVIYEANVREGNASNERNDMISLKDVTFRTSLSELYCVAGDYKVI